MDEVNIRFGASIDDLRSKLGQISELFKGIAEGAKAELGDQVGGAFTRFRESIGLTNGAWESFKGNLAAGFASRLISELSELPGKFIDLVRSSIDAADHLNDLSQKTGIAVETLGGFGFAASQSGSSLDSAAAAIGKLNKTIAEAAAGSKQAAEPFKQMGIDIRDSVTGNLKTADQVMYEVAQRFQLYEDGPNKAALAMRLFGKSGADLIPMLNEGAEALRNNVEWFEKYGGVSTETAQAADRFNDTIGKLHALSGAFGNYLAAAFLPVLQGVADAFLNAKEKSTFFQEAADVLATGLKGLVFVASGVVEAFMAVGRTMGGVGAIVVAALNRDFAQVGAIWDNMVSDNKARSAQFDEFRSRLMSGGTPASAAADTWGARAATGLCPA